MGGFFGMIFNIYNLRRFIEKPKRSVFIEHEETYHGIQARIVSLQFSYLYCRPLLVTEMLFKMYH